MFMRYEVKIMVTILTCKSNRPIGLHNTNSGVPDLFFFSGAIPNFAIFPCFCPFVFQSCFSYFSSFFFEATGGGGDRPSSGRCTTE